MARTTPIQTAFNAGELSPDMLGRVDLSIYAQGCSTLENFTPLVQGPAKKRPGTKFIRTSAGSFLASFQFSSKESYVLEFGRYRCWFSTNGQSLIDDTVNFTQVVTQNNDRFAAIYGTCSWVVNDRVRFGSVSGHPELSGIEGVIISAVGTKFSVLLDTPAVTNANVIGSTPVSRFYAIVTPWKLADDAVETISGIEKAAQAAITITNSDQLEAGNFYFATISGVVGMTEVNGNRYALYKSSNEVFLMKEDLTGFLDTSGFSTYVSGGTITIERECQPPWELGDEYGIRFAQSNDILYCVNALTPPQIMVRTSPTTFSLDEMELDGGPFIDVDPDQTTTVYASATSGTVNLVSSANLFKTTDVGRLFYLKNPKLSSVKPWQPGVATTAGKFARSDGKTYLAFANGTTGSTTPVHTEGTEYDGETGVPWIYMDAGFGWAKIVSYTDAKTVSASVHSPFPAQVTPVGAPTTRWAFGELCDELGYPDHVTFFRERLCLIRSNDQKIWLSVAGDYQNFRSRDESGEIVADMAVSTQIQSDQCNPVQWASPAQSLILGTLGGEFYLEENNRNNPFGPENYTIKKVTENGGRFVAPVRINNEIMYVQAAGRQLIGVKYSYEDQGYTSRDLSMFANHCVPKGDAISQMEKVRYPQPLLFVATEAGQCYCITLSREQEVVGWSRMLFGGEDAIVKSLTTIPSDDQDRDEVWLLVQRTINGNTVKTLERMEGDYDIGDAQKDAWFVDCGVSAESDVAFSSVSGLWHLEGEEVAILADGGIHPVQTVVDGSVNLVRAANKVVIGLPYTAKLVTLPLDKGQDEGTAQGKHKRLHHATIRFVNALGGEYGTSATKLREFEFRTTNSPMGAPEFFTGDFRVEATGGWGTEGKLWYINSDPTPSTIVAIMPEAVVNEH